MNTRAQRITKVRAQLEEVAGQLRGLSGTLSQEVGYVREASELYEAAEIVRRVRLRMERPDEEEQ